LGLCTAHTHTNASAHTYTYTHTIAELSTDAARTDAACTSPVYASTISHSLANSFSKPDATH
jgi:hypothetical protein